MVINAVKALEILLKLEIYDGILEETVRVAFKERITVYDSLYVSLAIRLNSYLLTYDEELLNKFRGSDEGQ